MTNIVRMSERAGSDEDQASINLIAREEGQVEVYRGGQEAQQVDIECESKYQREELRPCVMGYRDFA